MSENDNKIIFEQWKTCVELADSVTKQRNNLNNVFITLNIALITTFFAINNLNSWIIITIGTIIFLIWILLILNYRRINKAKFNVILKLEKELPFMPMDEEWKYLKSKKHIDFTIIEILFPLCFFILYFIVAFI